MRVLLAPDKFAGTLSAVQVAEAMQQGWLATRPGDQAVICPLSDGGPGFLAVLHRHLPDSRWSRAEAPLDAPVLWSGRTAYLEAATVIGRGPDVRTASSAPLGVLLDEVRTAGAERVVIGLGGTGVNDGGAGLLAGLGARANVALDQGPGLLGEIENCALPTWELPITVACDVDSVLLGLFGATKQFGPQKGLTEAELPAVDVALTRFAETLSLEASRLPGAGAGGGVGFGLALLGAELVRGFDLVAEQVGLSAAIGACDLVVTGEGLIDVTTRLGKVVAGVAQAATRALRPCIALAGGVDIGSRELRTLGLDSAYAVNDLSAIDSWSEPGPAVASAASRLARTWGW